MKRDNPWLISGVVVLAIGLAVALFALFVNAQSAVEMFRQAQGDDYFDTKDDAQDWSLYYIFREFDQMREDMREQNEVLRSDIREVRGWLWAIAGGGASAGGGGLLAWRKRRNGRKHEG